jgi:Domain of unknown function (DUF6434)/SAP domain-containing new25
VDRPDIAEIASGVELRRWYWLKSELVATARRLGVPVQGSKFEILDRVAAALDGDLSAAPNFFARQPASDTVPWRQRVLSCDTVITLDYTNGPATRAFFLEQCGEGFRLTIPFMAWMRANAGRTLGEAAAEWKRQTLERNDPAFRTMIPASNQYNQYLRDLFCDCPTASMAEARLAWKYRRSQPGDHRYEPGDLLRSRDVET